MYLAKRSNGNYYIFYKQDNGKLTCKSTKSKLKKEALQFLVQFKNELDAQSENTLFQISFKKFCFEFLKYSESIHSWNHTLAIKSTFNEIQKIIGNPQLTIISKSTLEEYFTYRLMNVSPYTVKRDIANMSSAFNWAIRKNFINNNPCLGIKKPKIPQKMPLFFSEEEFKLFLSTIKDKDLYDIIEFASYTGLRQSDLINLRWEQVNFKEGSIILDNRSTLTKSRKIHNLPLHPKALQILTRRKTTSSSEKIFTYLSKPIKQQFISHKFKKLIKKTNLNQKLNFHSIRHSFASWLIQGGVGIYQVSKLMTHSDLRVTQIYTHLRAEDLRASVNVLSDGQ